MISLDWHQVLDAVRRSQFTERPLGYSLTSSVTDILGKVKRAIPSSIIVINSYCNGPSFRNGVLSVQPQYPDLINHSIVTSERCGQWGKLAALGHLCNSNCRIVHFDDSAEVCEEFLRRSAQHPQLDGM